jgi:hypothetical protein
MFFLTFKSICCYIFYIAMLIGERKPEVKILNFELETKTYVI